MYFLLAVEKWLEQWGEHSIPGWFGSVCAAFECSSFACVHILWKLWFPSTV